MEASETWRNNVPGWHVDAFTRHASSNRVIRVPSSAVETCYWRISFLPSVGLKSAEDLAPPVLPRVFRDRGLRGGLSLGPIDAWRSVERRPKRRIITGATYGVAPRCWILCAVYRPSIFRPERRRSTASAGQAKPTPWVARPCGLVRNSMMAMKA